MRDYISYITRENVYILIYMSKKLLKYLFMELKKLRVCFSFFSRNLERCIDSKTMKKFININKSLQNKVTRLCKNL